MLDLGRLKHLVRARHACIRIVTDDEPRAYEIAYEAAETAELALFSWSVIEGLRAGVLADSEAVEGTQD
ncbi:MAG: hypothetical protein AABZ53_06655, partial [Planctomycetota bacterium]